MKKVLITGPAKDDIIKVRDYINNPIAYKNFIHTLSCVLDMLSEYPNTGVKKSCIKDSSVLV